MHRASAVAVAAAAAAAAAAAPRVPRIALGRAGVHVERRASVLRAPVRSFSSGGPPQDSARGNFDPTSRRVFSNYVMYGPKVAISMQLIRPRIALSNNQTYFTLKTPGSISLDFAPRQQANTSRFDWANKRNYQLRLSEIGEIVETSGKDFRLTFNSNSIDKTTSRTLVISALPDKRVNYRLHVKDAMGESELETQVSFGEHAVVKCLMHNTLPHLMAWGTLVDPIIEMNSMPGEDAVSQ